MFICLIVGALSDILHWWLTADSTYKGFAKGCKKCENYHIGGGRLDGRQYILQTDMARPSVTKVTCHESDGHHSWWSPCRNVKRVVFGL